MIWRFDDSENKILLVKYKEIVRHPFSLFGSKGIPEEEISPKFTHIFITFSLPKYCLCSTFSRLMAVIPPLLTIQTSATCLNVHTVKTERKEIPQFYLKIQQFILDFLISVFRTKLYHSSHLLFNRAIWKHVMISNAYI